MTEPTALAAGLDDARRNGRAIDQFAGRIGLTLGKAYDVLLRGIDLRRERGERVVGLKLGFTSKEKAVQMGVSDVILGVLTDRMRVVDAAELDHDSLIHPRVEPEIAFRLADDVPADEPLLPHVTHVAAAVEVIDSRYRDFSFSLADVVADNTSASHFAVGEWREVTDEMKSGGLSNLTVELFVDGDRAASGSTQAILGDPLASLVAATRLAARHGHPLAAGHIVLAGSATAAIPLPARARIEVKVEGIGAVSLRTTSRAMTGTVR
ncbi:2-keto-4-pentenoate hydratase [Amycolatopsis pithecellobii]|uniref:4-oxalocrotonate decarboxylase n=1 Tax=Amycolatopsis pithecellobii TaxID=664692 RepID=A0A6N7Z1U5_9PSEU|nr:fumarylacetoacetate hydrolase family protein [Amycolatopsis pithecellobii]MTD52496.1 4-oxalocrotonate decarboxylase [Amycolatopsis pithecellobii]